MEAEFGLSRSGSSPHRRMQCSTSVVWALSTRMSMAAAIGVVDVETGELRPIETPFNTFGFVHCCRIGRPHHLRCSRTRCGRSNRRHQLRHGRAVETIRASSGPELDPSYFSELQRRSHIPSNRGAAPSHAYYYAPRHPDFEGRRTDELTTLSHVHTWRSHQRDQRRASISVHPVLDDSWICGG